MAEHFNLQNSTKTPFVLSFATSSKFFPTSTLTGLASQSSGISWLSKWAWKSKNEGKYWFQEFWKSTLSFSLRNNSINPKKININLNRVFLFSWQTGEFCPDQELSCWQSNYTKYCSQICSFGAKTDTAYQDCLCLQKAIHLLLHLKKKTLPK